MVNVCWVRISDLWPADKFSHQYNSPLVRNVFKLLGSLTEEQIEKKINWPRLTTAGYECRPGQSD